MEWGLKSEVGVSNPPLNLAEVSEGEESPRTPDGLKNTQKRRSDIGNDAEREYFNPKTTLHSINLIVIV